MKAAPLISWRHALLDDRRLKQREQHVALVLSVYWDGDGRKANPSVKRIVQQTGMSERTVRYALAGIRDLGIVEVVAKPGRTTIYHAVIPYPTPATRAGGSVCTPLSEIAGGTATRAGGPLQPEQDEVVREVVTEVALEAESALEGGGPEPAVIAERFLEDKPLMDWMGRAGRHYLPSKADFRSELGRNFNIRAAVAEELRVLLLDAFQDAA